MKKIILNALLLCAFSFANAQESKGYIGVSFGASFPSGDLTNINDASTGINLGLINAGYRFTDTFGVTFNWGATAYSFDDYGDDTTFGIGYLALGPMFSFPLSSKIGVDLKPQIAFTTGVIDYGTYSSDTNTSTGLLLGSSINFPIADHWGLVLNFDYLSAKFNEVDGERMDSNYKASAFNTSLGIQYKF